GEEQEADDPDDGDEDHYDSEDDVHRRAASACQRIRCLRHRLVTFGGLVGKDARVGFASTPSFPHSPGSESERVDLLPAAPPFPRLINWVTDCHGSAGSDR